ncbi:MAG: ribosome small subunit-dependent GTPase A [Methanomicrobiales archaeon]|nr:ribosome small subunit-dependent GTPase A [Methanomicrobiales archaeon]
MTPEDSGCAPAHPSTLEQFGWTEEHTKAFRNYPEQYLPGRISCRQKTVWDVLTLKGTVTTGISGALKKLGRFPAVGDFVVLLHQPESGSSAIVDILPRRTQFTRGAAGRDSTDQVIAANVDTVFIVTAAGQDLNARRVERYLAIAHASGARPVIIINKADLADDAQALADAILPVAAGVPIITLSAKSGEGMREIDPYLTPGSTIVLIGSSGVGKSTLMNRLLGNNVQDTFATREDDDHGRHTTTVRQLFVLPCGALMIDNPGLREVGMGTASGGMDETFPDILELAEGCRFSDCRHENEPGCAVKAAVERGEIAVARLENYHRLMREIAFEQDKKEIGLVRTERKRWKEIGKLQKETGKGRRP